MIKGFPLSACASVLAAGVLALSAPMAAANPVKINYQQPAQDIIDIVDAAPSHRASLSQMAPYCW